jgi:hypothetical protein
MKNKFRLSSIQLKFQKSFLNSFSLSFYFLKNVPMLWLSGIRLIELSENHSVSQIPFKWYYRWQNMNPFKSIYFAVQCMAAELSTASIASLAIKGKKPSIALIVVSMSSKYLKKAVGNTTFRCEDGGKIFKVVEEAIKTGKGVTVEAKSVGRLDDGTKVSEFYFTWSFKQRKSE